MACDRCGSFDHDFHWMRWWVVMFAVALVVIVVAWLRGELRD
jgi:hypothetical protein